MRRASSRYVTRIKKKHMVSNVFMVDNNMINGTKLLNVAGMSRGKRDGILKNERGRIVVKVGAMHLKGVW
jgi:protein SOK2